MLTPAHPVVRVLAEEQAEALCLLLGAPGRPRTTTASTDVFESLSRALALQLVDLSRPASRDAWVRWWWNNQEGSITEIRDDVIALTNALQEALSPVGGS